MNRSFKTVYPPAEPLAQREFPREREGGTNVERAAIPAVALAFVSIGS